MKLKVWVVELQDADPYCGWHMQSIWSSPELAEIERARLAQKHRGGTYEISEIEVDKAYNE